MIIKSIGYTGKANNKQRVNNIQKPDKMTGVINTSKANPAFGSSESYLDMFFSMLESFTENLSTLKDILVHDNREKNFETYIDVFSQRNVRQIIKNFRNMNIEDFNNKLLRDLNINIDFFNKLLKSSGINSVMQMENFARTYTRNPDSRKIFKRQEIEAVKIYGLLKSKDDIARYPELLLYLYNQEGGKQDPDYGSLNEYTEFLRQAGLNDFKDFESKFAHLKSDFNDFGSIADKTDAIDYLRASYSDKIAYLDRLAKENNEIKAFDSAKIYAKINDVADTLYNSDTGDSEKTWAVIKCALASDKLKSNSLRAVAPFFNDFQTPQDKIILYELLCECGISPNDFNKITSRTVVSDADVLNCIINKQELSQYIADYRKTSVQEGESFYKNNADVINAVFDISSGSIEDFNSLIGLTDRFKINGSDSFLSFYNRASGTKNKQVSSDEIKNFIELFKYSDSNDLFKQAKGRNISVVDLLAEEKAKFELVKDDIEQYISADTTAYFAGKTPLEVYKSYRDLFMASDGDITDILSNISAFNIDNSEQYEQKAAQINEFAKFFTDRESLLEFISASKIKFDESEEDSIYYQNCLAVCNALYDENDIETSERRIGYMASSGFLEKSRIKLPDFMAQMSDRNIRKETLAVIADKQVPSLSALQRFFKTYAQDNDSGLELLKYLQNLPDDVDFNMSQQLLSQLQRKIKDLNIPVQINSSNINAVNIDRLASSGQISTEDAIASVNEILEVPEDSNFISALSLSVDTEKHMFDSFRIAQDIVAKKDLTDESYQNIVRLLGLDKNTLGLDSDCSDYTYIRAIEKVLPEEFIKFVNSNDWLDYKNDGETIPNLVLHARLRAIDRFALSDTDDINNLYSEETREKLKSLFKSVYEAKPLKVKGSDSSTRIIINSNYKSNVIEAVFSNKGEMITIVPARRQRA